MRKSLVSSLTLSAMIPALLLSCLTDGFAASGSVLRKGTEAYVSKFEKSDPQLIHRIADFTQGELKLKESGWKPPWEGYKNVKPRSDYEKLKTADLARECFSTSVWARDTLIYDEPAYGIARIGVFHDGFAVLYERPDFWDGIASVYEYLSQALPKAGTEFKQMDILFNLQTLEHAYTYPLFQKTLRGREKLLLRANLKALRAVLSYTRESKQNPQKPFWGAVVTSGLSYPVVALLKQVDPQKYSELIGQIEKVELAFAKPDPNQTEKYIQLLLSAAEEALAKEDAEAKQAKPDTGADADTPRR